MSFSERLRQRREALNMDRQELADKLGVTVSAIGNYETGVSHPKPEILYKIFDALTIDPNFLYQDEFSNNVKRLPELEEPIMKLYRQLDERDRGLACGYIEGLLTAPKYQKDPEQASG